MFCLCSTFASPSWNRPHLNPPTPSSLIYFSNPRCSWWSHIHHADVSTRYTQPSGMISNILRSNIRLAYPAGRGGAGGLKSNWTQVLSKEIIHEYQHHGLCMALKCPLNERYLSQVPVAISENHTVLAFICPSDTQSCRLQKKTCTPINT